MTGSNARCGVGNVRRLGSAVSSTCKRTRRREAVVASQWQKNAGQLGNAAVPADIGDFAIQLSQLLLQSSPLAFQQSQNLSIILPRDTHAHSPETEIRCHLSTRPTALLAKGRETGTTIGRNFLPTLGPLPGRPSGGVRELFITF
jgi:hypothetical protein